MLPEPFWPRGVIASVTSSEKREDSVPPDPGPDHEPAPDVDPELEALPPPPRARRLVAITLMALTVAASLGLAASLRKDVAYFFADGRVIDLGDVGGVDPAVLQPNTYVRVAGVPMASGTVRYTRIIGGSTYAVFPLAGQRTVFVQIPIDGPDDERMLSRREYVGRLVTFGQLAGRFGNVRSYLDGAMDMPVSSESFLVLADEPPGSYAWALALSALCLLFVLVNVWLMIRWFRPLPMGEPARATANDGSAA